MWSFHGYIADPLEHFAKQKLRNSGFTADDIEGGQFVEVMIHVLNSMNIQNDDFFFHCSPYKGKTHNQIPTEDAKRLFSEFCTLTGCPDTV